MDKLCRLTVCSVLPRISHRRGGVGVAKWNALVRNYFKHGRGHLSGICWLCSAVLKQHRVLVFGLKCCIIFLCVDRVQHNVISALSDIL